MGKKLFSILSTPGEVFGELALLDGKQRSADATAIGDCKVLLILRCDFLPYLEKHSHIAIQLLALLCQKIRNTSMALEDIGLLDIQARLARFLLKMSDNEDIVNEKTLRVNLKISHGQIGKLIGSSRESVNKQFNSWQKEGFIRKEMGGYSILRISEFKMFAEIA